MRLCIIFILKETTATLNDAVNYALLNYGQLHVASFLSQCSLVYNATHLSNCNYSNLSLHHSKIISYHSNCNSMKFPCLWFLRMSFSEFLRHYSRLEICTLTPDTLTSDDLKHWSVCKFDGTWRKGSTAGGCRNHPCETPMPNTPKPGFIDYESIFL